VTNNVSSLGSIHSRIARLVRSLHRGEVPR
jgi:hypothetical protein